MRNIAFLFIAFLAVTLVSCGGKTQPESVSPADSLVSDSVPEVVKAKSDTIVLEQVSKVSKLGCWNYSVEVAYPVDGPDALLASIRAWISESLNATADESGKGKAYKGDLSDGKAMLDYYSQAYLKSINYDDFADLPEDIECEMDFKITKEFEDEKIISFNLQTYWYGGGAHGGTSISGATFRKTDGKKLGWELIASKKALNTDIVAQLKTYFEVKTDEKLLDCLQLDPDIEGQPTIADIPCPRTEPWVSSQGIVLLYQQYEIACYAAGMPSVVIPWNKFGKYVAKQYQPLFMK